MGLFDPGPELVILILVIALLLFGSTKIPELARGLGRAMGEFRRGKSEIERELKEEELAYEKRKSTESPVTKAAKDLGIDVSGKSEEDLKREIARKLT